MKRHPETENLSAFLDGELTDRERVTMEAHIATCRECAADLAALRATVADLAMLDEPVLDDVTRRGIRVAVARERTLSSRSRRFGWVAGVAAASIVGILAFTLSTGGGRSASDSSARARGPAARIQVIERDLSEPALKGALDSLSSSWRDGNRSAALTRPEQPSAMPTPAGSQLATSNAGGGGGTGGTSFANAAKSVDQFYSSSAEAAQRCLDTLRTSKGTFNVLEIIAARFNKKPVFLYFFEAPAKKPTRIELWVVTRTDCQVSYFRQSRIPPE